MLQFPTSLKFIDAACVLSAFALGLWFPYLLWSVGLVVVLYLLACTVYFSFRGKAIMIVAISINPKGHIRKSTFVIRAALTLIWALMGFFVTDTMVWSSKYGFEVIYLWGGGLVFAMLLAVTYLAEHRIIQRIIKVRAKIIQPT